MLSLLSVLAAAVLPSGGAVVVNVDFQGAGGVAAHGEASAVLPSLGGYWNVQGASGETGLLSSGGGDGGARLDERLHGIAGFGGCDVWRLPGGQRGVAGPGLRSELRDCVVWCGQSPNAV